MGLKFCSTWMPLCTIRGKYFHPYPYLQALKSTFLEDLRRPPIGPGPWAHLGTRNTSPDTQNIPGIVHLKKVKTLILDSPKGDYTRRKERVFSTYIYIYIYICIHTCTCIYFRARPRALRYMHVHICMHMYMYMYIYRWKIPALSVWCSLPSGNPKSGF